MFKESGFTLIELFVVIGIMAIISAIAVPNIMAWGPNYRLRSATQDAFSDFQRARIMAMQQGVNCTITFDQTVDGVTYDYVVYVDSDNDLEYDAGEEIIADRRWAEYANVEEEDVTFNDNDESKPSIAFRSNGITRTNTGGFGAGTLALKNSIGRTSSVKIAAGGTIRID